MAKMTPSKGGADAPTASSWEPSPGMTFSTVELVNTTTARVTIEHPEGWSGDQVTRAAKGARIALSDRAEWWAPESERTTITRIYLGDADPSGEDEPVHREPVQLADDSEDPDPEVVE